METQVDKQALLDRIQHEAQVWDDFLREVGAARMEQPGAADEWTFKDVVAHLSGWRKQTIARLEAARDDRALEPIWPAEWDEEDDLEKINEWIYWENHNRDLHDVLTESRTQFRQLHDLVRELPEATLFERDRFAWMQGRPLADVLHFGHFHEEHEPTLRAWLAQS